MRYFLLILTITYCINCNNHKTYNKKNGALLSKTEAEELKDKLYKEYSLNLIVNRLKETGVKEEQIFWEDPQNGNNSEPAEAA